MTRRAITRVLPSPSCLPMLRRRRAQQAATGTLGRCHGPGCARECSTADRHMDGRYCSTTCRNGAIALAARRSA